MMKKCEKYTQDILGKYNDGELGPELENQIGNHLNVCDECKDFIESVNHLETLYSEYLEHETAEAGTELAAERFFEQKRKTLSGFKKFMNPVFFKRIYLPVISFVAIIVFSVNVFNIDRVGQLDLAAMAEPSAIVDSVDGDVSSVIIFETVTNHQTVIWFSETL